MKEKSNGGKAVYRLDLSRSVTCLMAGRMRQNHGWEHEGRKNLKNNLLVFVISGNATFHIDGREIDVARGDVLIIPKNTYYTAGTVDCCEYFFFHFNGELEPCTSSPSFFYSRSDFSFRMPPMQSSYVYLEEFLQTEEHCSEFLSRIGTCIGKGAGTTHTARLLMNVELEKILILLGGIRETEIGAGQLPALMVKLLANVRENLTVPITVSGLCKDFGISRSYLARLFKQHLHMTPIAYINRERMHYARELLHYSAMNISEVSEYLGYCDIFYFSKLYKRIFGVSPSKDMEA